MLYIYFERLGSAKLWKKLRDPGLKKVEKHWSKGWDLEDPCYGWVWVWGLCDYLTPL